MPFEIVDAERVKSFCTAIEKTPEIEKFNGEFLYLFPQYSKQYELAYSQITKPKVRNNSNLCPYYHQTAQHAPGILLDVQINSNNAVLCSRPKSFPFYLGSADSSGGHRLEWSKNF